MDSFTSILYVVIFCATITNISGITIGLVVLVPSISTELHDGIIKKREVIKVNETEVVIEIHAVALVKHDYYTSITQARSMTEDHVLDVILVYTDGCEEDYIKHTLSNRYIHVYCYTPFNTDQLVTVPNSGTLGNIGAGKCPARSSSTENQIPKSFFLSHHKSRIIWAIMDHYGYEPTVLIYDNTTEIPVIDVSNMMSTRGFKMVELNVDTVDDVVEFLKITYSQRDDTRRNYLVFCSLNCTINIIQLANGFDDMMKNTTAINQLSKWLIVDDNYGGNMEIYKKLQIDNIAVVHMEEENGIETNTHSLIQNILSDVKDILFYSSNMTQSDDLQTVANKQFKQALLKSGYCVKAQIHALLWQPGGREFNLVGEITHDYSIAGENKLFPNTDYGLNNKIFRVLVKEWFPFIIEKMTEDNKKEFYGLSMDLLHEISHSMNFSYILMEPEDNMWGHITNGSWKGIVKDLMEGKAEFSVAPLAITRERSLVVDFSFPYSHDYTVIVYKLPDPNLNKWKKLSVLLKPEVIVCIFVSFLLLLLLLYFTERSNPFYTIYPGKLPEFSHLAMYLYGAMLAQGGTNQPSSSSGRCIVAFWWLFTMIIVAAYCGNLIAFLSVSKDKQPFETLNDIGQQDEYRWGTVGSSAWETFLQYSNRSEIKRLWSGIVEFNKTDPDVLHNSIDVHFDKVDSGFYGLIADEQVVEIQMKTHCDWVLLKEQFFPMNYAVTLPRNSPYYQLIYKEMMRMYETGMFQSFERKWWNQKNFCGFSQFSDLKAMKLIDLQGAFYLMFLGMAISFAVLGGERISKYLS